MWQKSRIAAAHERFTCVHQVAPMCTPSNTCFRGPTGVHIANGISIGSAVFAGLVMVADTPTYHATPSLSNNIIIIIIIISTIRWSDISLVALRLRR